MISRHVLKDADRIKEALGKLPKFWDAKSAILYLKAKDYQWRQMEWIGFHFELLSTELLEKRSFTIPGDKYGNTTFDCKHAINWDMKSHAIRSDTHKAILNDVEAVDDSIEEHGCHGVILALLDVEYNDDNRSFQKWHSELKGGLSDYERDRMARNATSRYRKRSAQLQQVLILSIDKNNKDLLGIYNQGRNSDGSPRPPKYMLNIELADSLEIGRIEFDK